MKIYFNGQFVDKDNAKVSVFDHGFLYGDGVFEGIRAYNRLVFRLKEHIDRLYESAHTLLIDVGMSRQQMMDAVVATVKENNLNDGYIRLIVTRGVGDLGLDIRKCYGQSSIIIIADKITLYPQELYEKGMEIITVPTLQNHPESINPQIKSMNYLNNILAKIEAVNSGYNEALMLDHLGNVGECTGDNVFIFKNGQLITPSGGCLKGITRDAVLELARKMGIQTVEKMVSRHEIFNADECFLTGTAAELIPVVKVDGRQIADGKPGRETRQMIDAFHELTKTDGVKY